MITHKPPPRGHARRTIALDKKHATRKSRTSRSERKWRASKFASLSLVELLSRRNDELPELFGIEVRLELLIPVFVLELVKPLSELREGVLGEVAKTRFNFFNVAHGTHLNLCASFRHMGPQAAHLKMLHNRDERLRRAYK